MAQTNPQHHPSHTERGREAAAPLLPVQPLPSTAQGLQHHPHPRLEQGPEQSWICHGEVHEWYHQPHCSQSLCTQSRAEGGGR